MTLRLCAVNETNLKLLIKNQVWGVRQNRLNNWNIGDVVVFLVDKKVASIAEISGKCFISDTKIWEGGLYPYRIPIRVTKKILNTHRNPLSDNVIGTLMEVWGYYYGWGILRQSPIEGKTAKLILDFIMNEI